MLSLIVGPPGCGKTFKLVKDIGLLSKKYPVLVLDINYEYHFYGLDYVVVDLDFLEKIKDNGLYRIFPEEDKKDFLIRLLEKARNCIIVIEGGEHYFGRFNIGLTQQMCAIRTRNTAIFITFNSISSIDARLFQNAYYLEYYFNWSDYKLINRLKCFIPDISQIVHRMATSDRYSSYLIDLRDIKKRYQWNGNTFIDKIFLRSSCIYKKINRYLLLLR